MWTYIIYSQIINDHNILFILYISTLNSMILYIWKKNVNYCQFFFLEIWVLIKEKCIFARKLTSYDVNYWQNVAFIAFNYEMTYQHYHKCLTASSTTLNQFKPNIKNLCYRPFACCTYAQVTLSTSIIFSFKIVPFWLEKKNAITCWIVIGGHKSQVWNILWAGLRPSN